MEKEEKENDLIYKIQILKNALLSEKKKTSNLESEVNSLKKINQQLEKENELKENEVIKFTSERNKLISQINYHRHRSFIATGFEDSCPNINKVDEINEVNDINEVKERIIKEIEKDKDKENINSNESNINSKMINSNEYNNNNKSTNNEATIKKSEEKQIIKEKEKEKDSGGGGIFSKLLFSKKESHPTTDFIPNKPNIAIKEKEEKEKENTLN